MADYLQNNLYKVICFNIYIKGTNLTLISEISYKSVFL